jgi:lysophospholipase L1-like esterase
VPRRIFPAGTVTNTTGAPLRLTFYANSTTNRRETDLWTVDGSGYLSERIPNGVIVTTAASPGAYSAFAGPDDMDTLYRVAHTGSTRTAITATAIVTGNGSYAGNSDETAREQAYLTSIQAGAVSTRNLSTATLSAWSAANAATGIASGVDVQTILTPGAGGTLNPVFRYLRCAAAPRAVTATFPDNVTVKGFGLTASATELMPLVLFNHSGATAFEISIMGKGADQTKVRVSVDGAWISATPLAGPANTGSNYRLTVTLPDSAQHEIGIEFSGYSAWFRRLTVDPAAVVSRVQRNLGPRLIIVGDSQVEGANGTANVLGNSLGFAPEIGRLLGIADTWASGLGNTGYVADNAGSYVTIGSRITADVVNQAPDWVHLQAGQVDAGLASPPSYATMLTAVTSVLTTLQAGLPNALITHQAPFRPYTTNQTAGAATTAGLNVRNAIRDACLAKSVPFIDVSAWLTGTGNTGATTGSGNADLYMSTDGVHLSPAGHLAAGAMLAARLKRGLNLSGIAG